MKSYSLTKNALYLFAATLTMEELVIGGVSVPKIAGILVMAFALFEFRQSFKRTHSGIILLISVYLFIALLSLIWSYDVDDGIVRFLTYFQIFILGIIMINQFNSEEDIIRFFIFFAIGCFLAALDIIYNYHHGIFYSGVEAYEDADRYSAFGVDPNETGLLLVIGITFLLHYFEKLKKIGIVLIAAVIFVIVYGTFLTASRTAFALLVFSFAGFFFKKGRKLSTYISVVLVLGLIVGLMFYFNLIPMLTLQRLLSTRESVATGDFSGRESAWKNLFLIFLDHSLLGVGLGGSSAALKVYHFFVISSHNTYVNVLAQVGVIGFLPFIFICFRSFKEYYSLRNTYRWLFVSYMLMLIGIFTLTYDQKKMIWVFFFIAAIFETKKDIILTNENNTDS